MPTLGLPPAELITTSTSLAIQWRCPRNEFHDPILATLGGRAAGEHRGCRHCWANDQVADVAPGAAITRRAGGSTSRAEQRVLDELARHLRLSKKHNAVRTARPFFNFVWVPGHRDSRPPRRRRVRQPGAARRGAARRLATRRRLAQDELLREVGWEVVRLRTGGLDALGPHDVVAPGYSQRAVAEVADAVERASGRP